MPGYSPDQVPEPEIGEEPCRDCGHDCGSPEECEYNQGAGDPAHVPAAMARLADVADLRRQTHGPEGAPF